MAAGSDDVVEEDTGGKAGALRFVRVAISFLYIPFSGSKPGTSSVDASPMVENASTGIGSEAPSNKGSTLSLMQNRSFLKWMR